MASSHELNYGIAPSPVRRFLRKMVRILASLVLLIVALWAALYGLKMYDRVAVNLCLRSSSSTKTVEVIGFDDCFYRWQITSVIDHLNGGPGRKIEFLCPTAFELRSGSHLRLCSVGPYNMYTVNVDSSQPGYVDVGKEGDFAGLFQFRIGNAKDLISHYDQILKAIQKMPKSGSHKDARGKIVTYRIY